MKKFLLTSLASATLAAGGSAMAQTELEFWHAMSGNLQNILEGQVEAFNNSQDEYKVNATYKGNYTETMNAAIAAFRSGEQPDVVQVFEVGTATMMAAEGAIKPVYQLMDETGTEFDPSKYLQAVTGYYTTPEGEMLSLPYNSSTPVTWVNVDALEEAGLEPDVSLETWQDMGEVLATLRDNGHECPYVSAWQTWVQLENFSAYHNIPYATMENGFGGLGAELAFNSDTHVKHISTLAEWVEDGRMKYYGPRSEGQQAFTAGECAIFTQSSAGYGDIATNAEFNLEIRPLPYWEGVEGAPQNSIIGGASLWVFDGQPEEEYPGIAQFLSFLSQPEVQAEWHQGTGYLPITTAAYELSQEQGFYDENPGTDVGIKQMTGKAPTANSKGVRLGSFVQIRDIVDEELEAVWNGDKEAKEALDAAVERGNELLRRFEKANG